MHAQSHQAKKPGRHAARESFGPRPVLRAEADEDADVGSLKVRLAVAGAVQRNLYVLDVALPASMSWTDAVLSGSAPTARKGHTLTHSNSRLYLFGGSGGSSSQKLNDVYFLDLASLSWSSLTTGGEIPPGREGHAAAVLDDKLGSGEAGEATDGAQATSAAGNGGGEDPDDYPTEEELGLR